MALCILDKRLPDEAKQNISRYAEVIEFYTNGITYEPISGHPDIFFCKSGSKLIVSPNVPGEYLTILDKRHIKYKVGSTFSQMQYPQSAAYCAVINDEYLIHRIDITDKVIFETIGRSKNISVQQGYTRCNLLALKNNSFITSDNGMYSALCELRFNVLYVDPSEILLPGFRHGFFGGTCGVHKDGVFFAGNLDRLHDGQSVRRFLRVLKYNIIELYSGPLFDCGSILFI